MSIGIRAFIVEQSGITRVPWRRFEQWLCGVAAEPMYAGQHIRCALLYVELANRRPVALRHADYLLVNIDPDGRVDLEAARRRGSLAVQSVSATFDVSEPVVAFGPYLAKRQYRNEFRWVPTASEPEALLAAALK